MRLIPVAVLAGLALCACQKTQNSATPPVAAQGPSVAATPAPATVASLPTRKAGLWVETMTRDGKTGPMGGSIKMCLDAATDAKMTAFGRQMGNNACGQRSVTRGLDGAYHFTSTCALGNAGTVTSSGVASGNFDSKYVIHDESTVSGSSYAPMNGHHVTEITATYGGPCPAGMSAGDLEMANGMKVNINRMPQTRPLNDP
jgi:hypothetical protein